jgi:predicted nucleic acid-binding protein
MEQGYLIDTNTVIDFLDDKLPEASSVFLESITYQMSIISRMELLSWSNATNEQITVLQKFIESSIVYPLQEPIIVEAIRLRKNYKMKLPDAIIAATAVVFELTLITRNLSDFKNISGLKLIDSYSLK